MLAATLNVEPSLADDGSYAAVAEAIAGEGRLIQAMLVPGTHPLFYPPVVIDERSTPDEIRERLDELAADFEPIPPTSLLGIGDAATDAEQVVTLALAYPTLAEAQAAADVLPRRLETMTSLRTGRPWKEHLVERGVGTIDARAVEREDGEGALALLTFRAPIAGPEADPDTGFMTVSSRALPPVRRDDPGPRYRLAVAVGIVSDAHPPPRPFVTSPPWTPCTASRSRTMVSPWPGCCHRCGDEPGPGTASRWWTSGRPRGSGWHIRERRDELHHASGEHAPGEDRPLGDGRENTARGIHGCACSWLARVV